MMTEAEMVAELEAAIAKGQNPEGFYSTVELCELLGRREDAVRRRLRALKRSKRLEERRLLRPDELGSGSSMKWCYRILPAE